MAKKAKKTGITFEGVSFNKGRVNSFKTEGEFLSAMDEKGNAHVFEGDPERANKLKQLYFLVHSKEEKTVDAFEEPKAKVSKKLSRNN